MIPKIIHYCWFGTGKMNELHKKCIDSWKSKLSDYEFVLWDESKFDVESCMYTREAYKAKKYAYVSDYVRLYALKTYGGIYLDTDVMVLKSFNPLLNLNGFVCYENEKEKIPATCVIGASKGNKFINLFFEYYSNRSFINEYGSYDLVPNTVIMAKLIKKKSRDFTGIDITVFPSDYFSPAICNGIANITDTTYSIHYFDGSWIKNKDTVELEMDILLNKYIKIFGRKAGPFLYRNIQRIKKLGIIGWIRFLNNRKI